MDATIYYLEPIHDGRKSFYKKAYVVEERGYKTLYSYDTPVVQITWRGDLVRLWPGYSATTMRHVNEFLKQNGYGRDYGGKAWWNRQPARKYEDGFSYSARYRCFYHSPRAL